MGSGAATPKPISFIIQIIRWWYPFPRHGLLSSKQRLKRWKGATGITRIQIFQPYSLRRHYHICLKATLWNTLQRLRFRDIYCNVDAAARFVYKPPLAAELPNVLPKYFQQFQVKR